MTGHFFHLDHANLPVSDHTYIFCKLSFCQIVSELIDFLGSGVRKGIPGLSFSNSTSVPYFRFCFRTIRKTK